jgi:cellulose synthase operon protein C
MMKRQWIVAALVTGLAGAVAWACGPMFPNQLLDQRAGTLKATPQNSFAFEAMHLLEPTDKLTPEAPNVSSEGADQAAQAKALGLTPTQADRVAALKQSVNAAAAFEQGADLPADLRAYTAGAVAFAQGDIDVASTHFEEVLALPPEQGKLRSVWAAYMLGRTHAAKANDAAADAASFQRERAAAAKAFQLARARAVDGASDPQGLAIASFGDEARLYLYSHGTQCSWGSLYDDENHCGDGIATDDLKRAITLYAAQAGHGSDSGVQSLVAIAGHVLRNQPQMVGLLDGPVAQRMLVAYALARLDERTFDQPADTAAKPDPRLLALVQAIEQRGLDKVAGADRLASLAYEAGRYDMAARLADKSSGPLAAWVRAKLALQKGDLAAANADYAEAAKAFPKVGDAQPALEPANIELLTGEHGVLALARGEYVQALGHLYDAASGVGGDGNVYDEDEEVAGAGYGNDAAYIAERVLTVDELKAFVDARAPATPVPAKGKDENDYYRNLRPLGDNLRWLLARRLMRAGRYDEAQAYFPVDGDTRFGGYDDGKPKPSNLRAQAHAYATAIHDSEHAWTHIGKAEALYTAAKIAREEGMEILGYEQGPDYNDNGGSYQGGSGQEPDSLKQAFVTDGERQRYAASVAKPNLRFHYRYIAVDEASAAADLLPPRSQAFAAVMCKATGWMLEGPPDYSDHYQGYGEPVPTEPSQRERRATGLYQRYVKQGPYVEWADDFGRNCEEPDFARARALKRAEQVAAVRHVVRRYKPYGLAGFVAVIGGLAAWIMLRRRRKKAT